MDHEIQKTAEAYVRRQVGIFGDPVSEQAVKEAASKVAKAVEEVREARVRFDRSGGAGGGA